MTLRARWWLAYLAVSVLGAVGIFTTVRAAFGDVPNPPRAVLATLLWFALIGGFWAALNHIACNPAPKDYP